MRRRFGAGLERVISGNMVRVAYIIGAVTCGLVAVGIGRIFEVSERATLRCFHDHPLLFVCGAPLLFLLAAQVVFRFACHAGGSGIPQVMCALEQLKDQEPPGKMILEINGLRTAVVKVVSAVLALFAGASIGREGPTAQIGASVFQAISYPFGWLTGRLEMRSLLVAGASSGIAAAFNAPLAGVTFALEELAPRHFRHLKNFVLLSIIVAGATTQAVLGNYVYFGRHSTEETGIVSQLLTSLVVGMVCGLMSSVFCRGTLMMKSWIAEQRRVIQQVAVPLSIGFAVVGLAFLTDGHSIGPGRQLAMSSLHAQGKIGFVDSMGKLLATMFSFVSGAAGGIFAPSLSIGAGIGNILAQVGLYENVVLCGILGMCAFLSGVTQAPLTAIVIVTEMTDKHDNLLPIMCSSLISFAVAKVTQKGPFYHLLAEQMSKRLS